MYAKWSMKRIYIVSEKHVMMWPKSKQLLRPFNFPEKKKKNQVQKMYGYPQITGETISEFIPDYSIIDSVISTKY